MDFFGHLKSFPPADLLQWALNEVRTGTLVIRRSSKEKRVTFRGGRVVGCLSDDPAEFFGHYLLLTGKLRKNDLLHALTRCAESGERLGAAIRDLGILSEEEVGSALRNHIEDSVCGLFLWNRGVFYFEDDTPPEEDLLPEPVDTVGVVLEGTRWIDEMARIRKVFPNDDVVLRPGSKHEFEGLSVLEKRIVSGADGRRTLKQLYKGTRGSYFRFMEAALGLCVREVLDVQRVPEDAATTSTRDINIYELLMEQATDEEVGLYRDRVNLPFSAIENLVPLWLGRANETSTTLSSLCDGTRRLKEILAEEEALREELIVALGRGRLALLPVEVDRLDRMAELAGLSTGARWWRPGG